MKIVWILNHYAQEPQGPGGTRHYSLAKYLYKHGWQAYVIAASIETKTGRQRLSRGEISRLDLCNGIPFLWLKTPSYQGNGIGRILNMLTYAMQALLPFHLRQLPRPHVVIGSSVHPFAAWSGAMLARRYHVPFFFEVRDLWPQTLIDMRQMTPHSLQARLLHQLEKWLYRRAKRILVLMPRAIDYLEPLGVSPGKIVWLPNGVDLAEFPLPGAPPLRKVFVLMYFGAHGNANGLDNVVRAMALLRQRLLPQPVHLRLIGDGPLKPALIEQAKQLSLDNVSFEPPVSKNHIPSLAAHADGFVFNLVRAPIFKYGISSNKLFDFMASARPIVFCSDAINNPVKEAKAGITVPPDDPVSLANAIEMLVHTSVAQRNEMAFNARRYVEENHDYARLADKLATLLDETYTSRDPQAGVDH